MWWRCCSICWFWCWFTNGWKKTSVFELSIPYIVYFIIKFAGPDQPWVVCNSHACVHTCTHTHTHTHTEKYTQIRTHPQLKYLCMCHLDIVCILSHVRFQPYCSVCAVYIYIFIIQIELYASLHWQRGPVKKDHHKHNFFICRTRSVNSLQSHSTTLGFARRAATLAGLAVLVTVLAFVIHTTYALKTYSSCHGWLRESSAVAPSQRCIAKWPHLARHTTSKEI